LQSSSTVHRANGEKLKEIFSRYASVEKNGDKFMTPEDFIRSYLGLYAEQNFNSKTVKLLGSILDTSKDG